MLSVPATCAAAAVIAFLITYLMVPVSMKIATKVGAIDMPSERRVHTNPTTRMGGIALFAGIVLTSALLLSMGIQAGIVPAEFAFGKTTSANAWLLLLGFCFMFAMGAADDILQLRARTKFAGQIVAASIVVASGIVIQGIHITGLQTYIDFGFMAYPITVLYLVSFANVINLIDGLDGLAAGVTCIAATAFAVLAAAGGVYSVLIMAIAVAASCLAFLRFNFHPAKLFMGDCGSLSLGFALGIVSLSGAMRYAGLASIAVPVVIAAVPVIDTFAAIVRRKIKGVPISSPDKNHIHHVLLQKGFSQRHVVFDIYLMCAVFAGTGIAIYRAPTSVSVVVLITDILFAAFLIWKLGLFGKIMGRYYPEGRLSLFSKRRTRQEETVGIRNATASKEFVPMRILLVCEHFYPATDACSKRMTVLRDTLRDAGHEVFVLASETSLNEASDYFASNGVCYYSAFKMESKTVINRLRNNLSEAINSTKEALNFRDIDVVVVTSPPLLLSASGIRIAKKHHARLVFDARDIWPDVAYEMGSFSKNSIYGRVFQHLANSAYKRSSLITTVSQGKVSKLKALLPKKDAEKVRLVPNGLDLGFLLQDERADLIEKYQLDEGDVCVYVGNLGLAQGLSRLLEIAKRNDYARFLLFGSGAERDLLREKISSEGLSNVYLCGRVDARGVYTLLKHAKCAYVSLLNSNMKDSVPTKLFEALGCGCPVLLAAAGDSVDILAEAGLGVSCAPEDLDGLVKAFIEVFSREWTDCEKQRAVDCIKSKYSRQAASEVFVDLLSSEIEVYRA